VEQDDLEDEHWVERRIAIGFVVSTDYVRGVISIFKPEYLESATARTVVGWVLDYWEKYSRAPGKDIEGIYMQHLAAGMDKDKAASVEEVLASLSEDYDREKFNVDYLLDESRKYFAERRLRLHCEQIEGELDSGSVVEAEQLATQFSQIPSDLNNVVNPFTSEAVERAFSDTAQPLMTFGRALGYMWDSQFVREGFVALMGPEKRGKSFMLLEIAMRALMTDCNVAMFQAGDMSERQQVMRICIYLAQRSNDPKYCTKMYVPVVDCEINQTGNACCDEAPGFKVFDDDGMDKTHAELLEAFTRNPDYRYCKNNSCPSRRPMVWLTERKAVAPLTKHDARRAIHKFKGKFPKSFKLATYPNETLTVAEIKSLLATWERQEGFVPDVVVIDYADILAHDPDVSRMDFRHKENYKWQRLRALSQQRRCLVVTATQTDADSYSEHLLGMKNFSETKTKFAHVTAMYGLNQTSDEKRIGIMRVNEIVVREGDFDRKHVTYVLQRLQMGRPLLGSYSKNYFSKSSDDSV
jgi:hypothetical protein